MHKKVLVLGDELFCVALYTDLFRTEFRAPEGTTDATSFEIDPIMSCLGNCDVERSLDLNPDLAAIVIPQVAKDPNSGFLFFTDTYVYRIRAKLFRGYVLGVINDSVVNRKLIFAGGDELVLPEAAGGALMRRMFCESNWVN